MTNLFRAAAAIAFEVLIALPAHAIKPRIDSGGTSLDLNRISSAERAHYHGRYTQAIGILSSVIDKSPDFAGAYFVRARYYADAGRYAEALADADQVEAFHPDASQTKMLRATIALRQHDPSAALADLAQAAKMSPYSFWKQSYEGSENAPGTGYLHLVTQHSISFAFAYTSIAEQMLGHSDAAMEAFANALHAETDRPWYVLGQHCYIAAIAGLLEMAELTCGEAIATQGHDIGDNDSLGLAHLKMKQWGKAIQDYNKALYVRPDFTLSLYGRGIARRATGDIAGGDADIAAAKRDEPDIANILAQMGVQAS